MKRAAVATAFVLGSFGIITAPCRAQQAASLSPAEQPRVFSLPRATLAKLRARVAARHFESPALDQLRKSAASALAQPVLSVMEKSITPPSGDKHDYMSLAPYWWPDLAKPGGLPYIRRDGETNPEIYQLSDHRDFAKLMSSVHTLALAYYFFRDESYAAHASELLRAWFLDPATRMNPNLQFAQGIRGINTGRGIGLIETRGVYRVIDAVGLLAGSRAWSPADQKGVEDWCAKFLAWMRDSENGKAEAASKNNHGTYYDVQITALALFTGNRELAKQTVETARSKRIALQIEPDGRQPLELARTKSLGYSTMNLAGLFELALLGDNAGADLWNFQTPDGRGIRKALDYLLPFVSGKEKWPYPQIAPFNDSEFARLLIIAISKWNDQQYRDLALKMDPSVPRNVDMLTFISSAR